jgi:hypothetical protein
MNVIKVLKKERHKLLRKVAGIDGAIAALGGRRKKTRMMSAAVRRKISATQKANWRKKRAGK